MEAVKVEQSDKETAVRNVLFETFCQQYHSLASYIQKLPLAEEMKGKIALFMDTGFLWTKEAFILAEIQQKAALSAVPNAPDNGVVLDIDLPEKPGAL